MFYQDGSNVSPSSRGLVFFFSWYEIDLEMFSYLNKSFPMKWYCVASEDRGHVLHDGAEKLTCVVVVQVQDITSQSSVYNLHYKYEEREE